MFSREYWVYNSAKPDFLFDASRCPMTRLISYVKNPIELSESGRRNCLTVYGIGSLKGAFRGRGLVYSSIQGVDEVARLNCQFELSQPTRAEYTIEQGQVTVEFDPIDKFPCAGIVTSNGEGYMFAPALKLDVGKDREIVLMLLSPPARPHNVSVEKTVLAIPGEEATMTLTAESGELRCLATVSSGSKGARVILNRNPRLPVYKAGFNETLGKLKGRGRINAVWRPVGRSFEDLVLVFDPASICSFEANSLSFDRIPSHLSGREFKNAGTFGDYVIGDGIGVSYTIRLLLDRGLRRHSSDEAKLTVA
jgi:hypothetical protein